MMVQSIPRRGVSETTVRRRGCQSTAVRLEGAAYNAAMFKGIRGLAVTLCSFALLIVIAAASAVPAPSWTGVLRDGAGKALAEARIALHAEPGNREYTTVSSALGQFLFVDLPAGTYELSVTIAGRTWRAAKPVIIQEGAALTSALKLSGSSNEVLFSAEGGVATPTQGSGGEHLSSAEVAGLPLNERDFSKLLLLAAGTMTDTNGAANFTQQFAFNGQRGVNTVFAMDGGTTTDPELGGATFANFNVDAIREVQSNSGVMPAEIGQGAAGFTNVVTKSGKGQLHGSAFEFVRNAAFDAKNFFDITNPLDPRRIPPFVRNEFGATIGGPVMLPGIYDGRGKTFSFGEYAGFRQVLGTTQVFAVPTA